jgi:transcriptional regulator with XRE-family HTH domain
MRPSLEKRQNNVDVSDRIEYLRKRHGISLQHLNDAIGAYKGKITEVRNGKSSFNRDELQIIARELSTTVDFLLGITDNPDAVKESDYGLSPAELELLTKFRALDDIGQARILNSLNFEYQSAAVKNS